MRCKPRRHRRPIVMHPGRCSAERLGGVGPMVAVDRLLATEGSHGGAATAATPGGRSTCGVRVRAA
jgi:hypothetical protein